jgi:transcriptional regulator with XRE-family HTH domain
VRLAGGRGKSSRGLSGAWDPVGRQEVAGLLGVSLQRVDQWERERAAGKRETFPAPVKTLAQGPLWDRSAIEEFGRVRRRLGGPEPGTVARPPRALEGLPSEELAAVIEGREAELSDREREVLRMRLGMESGMERDMGAGRRALQPMGQQTVAQRLGITAAAVKKAQQRAIEKVLAALAGAG